MGADFFERQDVARRKTGKLVVLFVLGVLAVVGVMNLVVGVLFVGLGVLSSVQEVSSLGEHGTRSAHRKGDGSLPDLWRNYPQVFLITTGATLAIMLIGTVYKWIALAGGGAAVARMLGGRQVDPSTRDPGERVLLDVVEEMAIASGCRVPAVYLMDSEPGVNAFAAGYTQADAVIGVTRGAVELLSRDELQGVVAHEYSHILHRDMSLNLRLMALLHGIMALAVAGYVLVRIIFEGGTSRSSRSSSGKGGAGAVVFILGVLALGVAMIAIGYIGVFAGKLVQAAVSRQREFLADASAVQFTRNPRGLASALNRLRGTGGRMASAQAVEAAHLMFGAVRGNWLGRLTATHPPLEERIEAIAPGFLAEPGADRAAFIPSSGQGRGEASARSGFVGGGPSAVVGQAARSGGSPATGQSWSDRDGVGLRSGSGGVGVRLEEMELAGPAMPGRRAVARAEVLIGGIPDSLKEAAHDPFSARAAVLAVLFGSHSAEARASAVEAVTHLVGGDGTLGEARRLLPAVLELDPGARMPLIDLTLPTLRGLGVAQARAFRKALSTAVAADGEVSLFEYCLLQVVERALRQAEGRPSPRGGGAAAVSVVSAEATAVLALVARADGRSARDAQRVFSTGLRSLRIPDVPLPPPDGGVMLLDRAITKLSVAAVGVRRRVLEAVANAVAVDGIVGPEEAELVRAIGAALDVAVPPVLALDPEG